MRADDGMLERQGMQVKSFAVGRDWAFSRAMFGLREICVGSIPEGGKGSGIIHWGHRGKPDPKLYLPADANCREENADDFPCRASLRRTSWVRS